jgi:paired amphipathic helix protein Sin3a
MSSEPPQTTVKLDSVVPTPLAPTPHLHDPYPPAGKPPLPDVLNPRIEALAQEGQRPRSRAKTRTPRPDTPKEDPAGAIVDPARPLNVADALGYLDNVKTQFADKPDVYNYFVRFPRPLASSLL